MKQYTQFKAYLQNYLNKIAPKFTSESGITAIEVMGAMVVSTIILNFAFQGFADYRQTFLQDQVSNDVNQRLRGIFAMMGPDIKQTGEGLISDPKFPAVVVSKLNVPNTNPVVTTTEIIVRRGLIDTPLPICQPVVAGTTNAVVVMDDAPTAIKGCELYDNDNNGWPDVVKQWRDQRNSGGGTLRAYIYDGVGNGEFFDYNGEITKSIVNANMTPSAGNTPYTVALNNSGYTWQNNYTPNDSSRIYLIEERRYRLELDPLDPTHPNYPNSATTPPNPKLNNFQLVIDENQTLDLVSEIDKLEVKAMVKLDSSAGSTVYECDVIPPTQSTDCRDSSNNAWTDFDTYSWAQIQSIDVTITALPADILAQDASDYLESSDLKLTQKFFPRNIFSF